MSGVVTRTAGAEIMTIFGCFVIGLLCYLGGTVLLLAGAYLAGSVFVGVGIIASLLFWKQVLNKNG